MEEHTSCLVGETFVPPVTVCRDEALKSVKILYILIDGEVEENHSFQREPEGNALDRW